jgi:phospholipid transport system substrate-binding protein
MGLIGVRACTSIQPPIAPNQLASASVRDPPATRTASRMLRMNSIATPLTCLAIASVLLIAIGSLRALASEHDGQQALTPSTPGEPIDSSSSPPSQPADESASAAVERLHAALLLSMKESERVGYLNRYEMLVPVITENFDLELMARRTIGRTQWKSLSPEQQTLWLTTFAQTVTCDYADRFIGYGAQQFETLDVTEGNRATTIVHTVLRDPEGTDISFNYRLRETDAGWRIIDIFLKGRVSELALRKSEYASMIDREGFDHLVDTLAQKHANLMTGPTE